MANSSDLLLFHLMTKNKVALQAAAILQEDSKQQTFGNTEVFNLDNYNDEEAEFLFRFKKDEIVKLKNCFRIPDKIVTENRATCDGLEGLCILLRRFSYPNRLGDLTLMFRHSASVLSRIINYMIHFIIQHFGHLLEDFTSIWLNENNIIEYAESISMKGCPLNTCFGFIDGTIMEICRPSIHQRECYSGHKRIHGLKFQSLLVPNGLIVNLYGPVEASRHDAFLLTTSGLLPKLKEKCEINDTTYCIYGDQAYPNRPQLLSPYRGANLQPHQIEFNKTMSSLRQSVEWPFGKIMSLFAFVDFEKNIKLMLQPVGNYYKIAAILTNCHTCFNGSLTSIYFNLTPPNLEDYLVYND